MNKPLEFVSSYLFAIIILSLLFVLTFLGTLYQVDHGLHASMEKYFTSFFLIHDLFGVVPLPLPGVYLLLVLLAINLTAGGILRMRKDKRRIGILTIHIGILTLLAGGFVEERLKTEGHMTLFEQESASIYESYVEWELVMTPVNQDGEVTEYRIPGKHFVSMQPHETRTFHADGLPFELTLSGYQRNTTPQPVRPGAPRNVNGFYLHPLDWNPTAEQNLAGAYATLTVPESGEQHEGILFGRTLFSRTLHPWVVEVNGEEWAVDLRRRRWEVPFTITLNQFERELHPRTMMAARFSSHVTKTEGNDLQQIHITMNEPLRHRGYTFYQASWGPDPNSDPPPPPNMPLFSTFAVVNNPADQFPMWACIIVGFGLVYHFAQRLFGYLRAESRRAAS